MQILSLEDNWNEINSLFSGKNDKIQATLVISKSEGTIWNTSRYPYLDTSDL